MNSITTVTRRDIFDIIFEGLDEYIYYDYRGRSDEITILSSVYNLDELPSTDNRFNTAKQDIYQHTISNDDWQNDWILKYPFFDFMSMPDAEFLQFICKIFHPEIRKDGWESYFYKFNELLKVDGYELYSVERISGRDVFGWRCVKEKENFIPFSQKEVNKELKLYLDKRSRYQINQILLKYDVPYEIVDETGFCYRISISEAVFNDVKCFYVPKAFENNEYKESENIGKFITGGSSPKYVFDVIELFSKYEESESFTQEINRVFELNKIDFILQNGKINSNVQKDIVNIDISVEEKGLADLLQIAAHYYNKNEKRIAVEKIWDAFERMKTYYYPTLNKKDSANKIIENASKSNPEILNLFSAEFSELTKIGNAFQIRHHEQDKFEINEDKHYEYLYKRCLSLITVVLDLIDGNL